MFPPVTQTEDRPHPARWPTAQEGRGGASRAWLGRDRKAKEAVSPESAPGSLP